MKKFRAIFFLIHILSCGSCSYDVYKDVFQINRYPRSVKKENDSVKLKEPNSSIVHIISDNKPYKLGYALGKVFSPTTFKSVATSLLPDTEISQSFEHTENGNVPTPRVNVEVTESSKENLVDVKKPPISVTTFNDHDDIIEVPVKYTESNPEKHDLNKPTLLNFQINNPTKSCETNNTFIRHMLRNIFEEIDKDTYSKAYKDLTESLDGFKGANVMLHKKISNTPTVILDPHLNFYIQFNIDPETLNSKYKVNIEEKPKFSPTHNLERDIIGTDIQHEVSNIIKINHTLSDENDSMESVNNIINVKYESANKTEDITNNGTNLENLSFAPYPHYVYKQCPQLNQNHLQDAQLQMYYQNYQNINPQIYTSTPLNVANHLSYTTEVIKPKRMDVLPKVVVLAPKTKNFIEEDKIRLENLINTGASGNTRTFINIKENASTNPINQRIAGSTSRPSFTNTNYDYSGTVGQSNCVVNPHLYYL